MTAPEPGVRAAARRWTPRPSVARPPPRDPAATTDPAATDRPRPPAATPPPTATAARHQPAPTTPRRPRRPAARRAAPRHGPGLRRAAGRAADRPAVRDVPAAPLHRRPARHLARHGALGLAVRRAPSASRSRTSTIPAQRGTIYDRNGVELAVSEDSVTVFANPFLIKDPAQGGRAARPAHGHAGGRAAAEALRPQHGLRLPAPQDGPDRPATKVAEAEDPGHRHDVGAEARSTRRASWPRRCSGMVGTDNYGLVGARVRSQDETLRGHGRRAPARQGRARQAGEHGGDEARERRARTST